MTSGVPFGTQVALLSVKSTGSPPAIMTAILDALRPLGVKELDMPATPFRVWKAIAAATAKAA